MIVSFIGIVILSLAKKSEGQVGSLQFYFGFFSIIISTIIYSTAGVITRKM
jgi:uncharacterized membrane-anchored protein YitT (DUF2179 family)